MTFEEARRAAIERLDALGVVLTHEERRAVEVTDFGLGELERSGLQLLTYVNTERVCAKELVLFSRQTCPEHRHPPVAGEPGKEEVFRCRAGVVHLYVPGSETPEEERSAAPPDAGKDTYTVFHQVTLRPGEQYRIPPDTLHWFQAGDDGAVVSEFSTRSRDETDVFTDPAIRRV